MIKILKENRYRLLNSFFKCSVFIFVGLFMFSGYVFPVMVGAEGGTGNGGGTGNSNNSVQINTSIDNPLGSVDSIPSFIKAVITAVLYIGVPIVALAIIYSGFLFVSAQGNSEKLTKAKKALIYTLIGAALLLGAFVIANAIQSTVDEIKKSA